VCVCVYCMCQEICTLIAKTIFTRNSLCHFGYNFLTWTVKFSYNSDSSEASIFNHLANLHSGVYMCPRVVCSFLTITEKKLAIGFKFYSSKYYLSSKFTL